MSVQLDMPSARVPRVVVPHGRIGLLVVAAAVVPLLYRELVKQGKKLNEERAKRAAQKPKEAVQPSQAKAEPPVKETEAGTPATEGAPKRSVSNTRSSRGTTTPRTRMTSASPAGHEEISAASAAEAEGQTAPPKRRAPKRKTAAKAPTTDQPNNPKRTRKSRPD